MQIIKHALSSGKREGSIQVTLSKFLFMYRITPHSSTGSSPSELLMGRRLRNRLDLYFPTAEKKVIQAQERQKKYHDKSKTLRTFCIGDHVLIKNFRSKKPKWLAGSIVKCSGPLSYHIRLSDGVITRRHVDHI